MYELFPDETFLFYLINDSPTPRTELIDNLLVVENNY